MKTENINALCTDTRTYIVEQIDHYKDCIKDDTQDIDMDLILADLADYFKHQLTTMIEMWNTDDILDLHDIRYMTTEMQRVKEIAQHIYDAVHSNQ